MNHLSRRFLFVTSLALAGLTGACNDNGSSDGPGGDSQIGTAGSTSRMAIVGDHLYAIAGSNVQLFDISAPESPSPWIQVPINLDIQTLFPYQQYLLVGAADGVYILDNTDQANPQLVGEFQHARAVDPVVAQNGIAYVTLKRDDTQPGVGIANQLNVIDMADPTQPQLIETVAMQGPAGLAVDGEQLFVCDGPAGLKVFDLNDPVKPVVSHTVQNVDCRDVIAQNELLYVIDDRGLSQYSSSGAFPMLLSTLKTAPVVYVVDR